MGYRPLPQRREQERRRRIVIVIATITITPTTPTMTGTTSVLWFALSEFLILAVEASAGGALLTLLWNASPPDSRLALRAGAGGDGNGDGCGDVGSDLGM